MLLGKTPYFRLPSRWTLTELFALLALIPIFLYNGKKGFVPKQKWLPRPYKSDFMPFIPCIC